MLRARAAFPCLLLLLACDRGGDSASTPPAESAAPEGAVEVPTLPATLVGTFVPASQDEEGRVLIVSEDMLAAIGCASCGVPTYVRLDTIACATGEACEVAGEGCQGRLERRGESLVVSMKGEGDAAEKCAGYAGEFVPGEMVGSAGQVMTASEAPGGHVVIGDITSPRDVDLDAARRVVDGRVAELDACYSNALIETPTLTGWLVIEVVHGARGANKAPANVHEAGFEHPTVTECLAGALANQDYPVADDGMPAPVYYTLELVLR